MKETKPTEQPITPAHQWVNKDGEVLILRFADKQGKSYGEFQHPMTVGETVTAPDWQATTACGNGIHGWPLGLSMGDGKETVWEALWQVYGVLPAEIVGNLEGGGKCKFRTGTLRYLGDWQGATNFLLADQIEWVQHASRGAASSTGFRGAASSTGRCGAASSTGRCGAASSTGYSSAASSTGFSSFAAVTGLDGKARAGEYGCIAIAWWNAKKERSEMRCALVGQGQGKGNLKANVWYTLTKSGKFVEVKE